VLRDRRSAAPEKEGDTDIFQWTRWSVAKEETVETRRTMLPAITLSNDPCPFCRFPPEKAVLVEIGRFDGMTRRTLNQVACACSAAGPLRSSPAEAALGWRTARERDTPKDEVAAWNGTPRQPSATVESFHVWSPTGK